MSWNPGAASRAGGRDHSCFGSGHEQKTGPERERVPALVPVTVQETRGSLAWGAGFDWELHLPCETLAYSSNRLNMERVLQSKPLPW